MSNIENERILAFQERLLSWYSKNRKDYPWRKTSDPYLIMVSEFMLQQTQTSRVVPKYEAFIEKFPTIDTLARSENIEVLELWSGLGYNRRALWLKEAAQKLHSLGHFPMNFKELKKIKGIGDYTSRAILIFAFNQDIATVDTNIRRIFIHEGFATPDTSDKELFQIAELLLPKGRSRDYHSALMDYGNVILTSTKTKIKPKTVQGKFEGSTRQIRGQIIKYLTHTKKEASKEELIKVCESNKEKIDKILEKLEKDGLIKKKENYYFIQ